MILTKEVLQALKELQEAINHQTMLINKLWATTEHRCPRCNRIITLIEEWDFIGANNECFACEHVRGGDRQ